MGYSVYISPSTQENNIGAGTYGTEEKRMNEVADVVVRELTRHGVTVYRNQPTMTLAEVIKDSNAKKPMLHLAIHSNAGGGRGCELYCYRLDGGKGEIFARNLYTDLSAITPVNDRGVHAGENFYGQGISMAELAHTNAPAALVEIDFHDSKDGAAWIVNNIEQIGMTLVKSIINTLGLIWIEDSLADIKAAVQVLHNTEPVIISDVNLWVDRASKDIQIKALIKKMAFFAIRKEKYYGG